MNKQKEGVYTFSSQPKSVQQNQKYRNAFEEESDEPVQFGNIMYDRRVVRGSTYAQHTIPTHAQPDPIEVQRQQEARRRAIARKRARQQLRPRTPDAVDGRKHIDVQTELYLEELSDRIEEADKDAQTDAFLDRPASPLFVPAKSGIDVATEIGENDLFDFDIEVRPILEVLVGKTVEQSLLEVMQEEELANLRQQQREFEELRNAEVCEQQRLAEQERRHVEEKERRQHQQKEILSKERETAEKIAAQAFAQSYLQDLVPTVFGTLGDFGYFYDPVERDIEQNFMPWLTTQALERLDQAMLGRLVLDGLIRDVIRARCQARIDQAYLDAQSECATEAVGEEGATEEGGGEGATNATGGGNAALGIPDIQVREPTEAGDPEDQGDIDGDVPKEEGEEEGEGE